MALQSLVGISLEPIAPARETTKRLLDGASRHIADAKVQAVSSETASRKCLRGSAYARGCRIACTRIPNADHQAGSSSDGNSDVVSFA